MYAHVLIHDQVARNRTAFYLQQHVERETKTNQLAITHGQLCCWVYCATCFYRSKLPAYHGLIRQSKGKREGKGKRVGVKAFSRIEWTLNTTQALGLDCVYR